MDLAGSSGESQAELERTIQELVRRNKRLDERVERLESLEFSARGVGFGCLLYEDYVDGVGASLNVSIDPILTEGGNYPATQLSIFWRFSAVNGALTNPLYFRLNALAGNDYDYVYKYSHGAAVVNAGAVAQTRFIAGRIPDSATEGAAMGWLHIPFYSIAGDKVCFGDWYLRAQSEGVWQEKGEWGGFFNGALGFRPSGFDFFTNVANISGRAYLYLWCPEQTPGGAPHD